MVERVKLNPKRQRAKANHKYFTETNVLTFKPKRMKQYLIWDAWTDERKRGLDPARGLAILVSPSGAKSYRVVYYFPGDPKPHYKHLGAVGGITLERARALAKQVRETAKRGDDPKADDVSQSDNFESAVKDYIKHEQVGRHGNKSAEKTERVLLNNCKPWVKRPVAAIRYREIEQLLWLGSGLIKSTIQELRRGRQRPGNFGPACRSALRCA